MRKFYTKTFRFRRISLSIMIDEYIILYRGKNRVYLRKISKPHLPFPLKYAFYTLPLIVLVIGVLFVSGNAIPDFGSPDRLAVENEMSDEEKKNQILFSEQTDFTEPVRRVKLRIVDYTVKKGETLSSLAKKFGVSMDTIQGCNKLQSVEAVVPGKVLKIPNKDGVLYKVAKGQSLITIAKKYKASIKKMMEENDIKNFDFFPAERYVFIPDAKPLNRFKDFIWPAFQRFLTCRFGWRIHPIRRIRHFHQGIDIKAKYEWIKATKYGMVTYAGWMGGFGKVVIIAHPDGWKSLYGHLSQVAVRNGQYVKQGQYIGKSGTTGLSTGPHLHFELIKNGRHVNPSKYVK